MLFSWGKLLLHESEIGTKEKYEKLYNWRNNDLDMNDYRLPDIFE
jgi:hypothetical protein